MKKTDLEYYKECVTICLSRTPKTQKELEDLTGIDRREVRKIIRELRIEGMKICSGNAGFWIWDGKDDSWERTKRAIIRKAVSGFELMNAIKRNEANEDQLSWEVSA